MNVPSNMGPNGRPGASLYGWSEFFFNSDIFGADIDTEILFNTDKIKTFYCDQTNPHIIKYMWNEPKLQENFDVIIEDGLHTFNANVCFFENSIHKLHLFTFQTPIIYDDSALKAESSRYKGDLSVKSNSYLITFQRCRPSRSAFEM